jgi:hypothetical protein
LIARQQAWCTRSTPTPKIEALRPLQAELGHFKRTRRRDDKLVIARAQNRRARNLKIEESQESSSCLENCSVLPQIKKLSSVSEGFSENRKVSQKIGRFLGKSEGFSENRKLSSAFKRGFSFLRNRKKIEKISQVADNSFPTK